jgi:hypothetical protein
MAEGEDRNEVLVKTAQLAGGALAVTAGGTPGLAAWTLSMIPSALAKSQIRAVQKRVDRFREELAIAMEFSDPEEVEDFIDKNLDDEHVRAALLEGFRALMGALDEAVIPSIAKLTAIPIAEKRLPGTTERQVGELLSNVGRAEFALLGQILQTSDVENAYCQVRHRVNAGRCWGPFSDENPEFILAIGRESLPHHLDKIAFDRLGFLCRRFGASTDRVNTFRLDREVASLLRKIVGPRRALRRYEPRIEPSFIKYNRQGELLPEEEWAENPKAGAVEPDT